MLGGQNKGVSPWVIVMTILGIVAAFTIVITLREDYLNIKSKPTIPIASPEVAGVKEVKSATPTIVDGSINMPNHLSDKQGGKDLERDKKLRSRWEDAAADFNMISVLAIRDGAEPLPAEAKRAMIFFKSSGLSHEWWAETETSSMSIGNITGWSIKEGKRRINSMKDIGDLSIVSHSYLKENLEELTKITKFLKILYGWEG